MKRIQCRHCGSMQLQRLNREGFWQLHVLPFFDLYPWRCIRCGRRTFSTQRIDPDVLQQGNDGAPPRW